MGKFANKGLIELYKKIGLNDPKFFSGKSVVNLFRILQAEPEIKEDGTRLLTPYEVLGVLPKFENGVEKPIVFAIKNRVSRIGKYEGQITNFVYKKPKIKEEKSVIQTLKERYRAAIFAGDENEAESCLKMIESLSPSESRAFKDSFYDYTKFYKRMKRQLLIDLFAHFFLMFVQARSSIIKNGIIKKNKLYKPYHEKVRVEYQDVTFNSDLDIVSFAPQIDPVAFGLQNVKKVVVNNKEMDNVAEFDISSKGVKVKTSASFESSASSVASPNQKAETELPSASIQSVVHHDNEKPLAENEILPNLAGGVFKSFLRKKRKKLFRKLGGMVPSYVHDETEEEKVPFSKKERTVLREREIEV